MAKRKRKAEVHGIVKHPNVLAAEWLTTPKVRKRALGIDFGNLCGYSIFEYLPTELPCDVVPMMGVWNLKPGEWDTGATRLLRLHQFLNIVLPDVIFYEDARFNPPADMLKGKANMGAIIARALTGSRPLIALHAATVLWAEQHGIPTHGYAIGAIKKYATGKGVASKEVMVEAANTRWGLELDMEKNKGIDNAVDATFALCLGMDEYMEGLQ
jgi:hypothetical protein